MPGPSVDPLVQTAEATLCRVVIGDAGGAEAAGMRVEDACSRDALVALAAECGLTRLRPHGIADDLTAAAMSADPAVRGAASATIARFGRRVGAVVATLRDPATAEAQGDTPARRAYLSHWLTVDRISLAGGLLAGACSSVAAAAAAWGAAAVRPCPVVLAPHPASMPLLGAARLACGGEPGEAIAVADLGQTSIRTAVVERTAGALAGLDVTGVAPAPAGGGPDEVAEAVGAALADAVRCALARQPDSRVRVVVSVAAHVAAGVPVDDGAGAYGCLAGRVDAIRRRIALGTGEAVLYFVHDATAAAAVGSPNSATITLGTWPGSGFRPAGAAALADPAPTLRITGR